jgi:hypothetical protein
MRSILAFCVVLVVATPAWAQNNVPSQEPFSQQPAVSTPVPNIHAPGAAAVTTPSTVVQQGTATAPIATTPTGAPTTTYYGITVAAQPGATTMVPAGNATYYYYPAGNSGRMFRMTAPANVYSANSTPVYTTPTQMYYTPVRRGFPFGLFRRRFAQPAYTTAAYTTTPTYYTTPSYYYTPTTYAVPATTSPGMITTGAVLPNTTTGTANPVYTPTTYTVPTETAPAGTVTPSGTTVPSGTTPAPSTTRPSGTTVPSRTIPAPPPVSPR